jgi:hypothetical protein
MNIDLWSLLRSVRVLLRCGLVILYDCDKQRLWGLACRAIHEGNRPCTCGMPIARHPMVRLQPHSPLTMPHCTALGSGKIACCSTSACRRLLRHRHWGSQGERVVYGCFLALCPGCRARNDGVYSLYSPFVRLWRPCVVRSCEYRSIDRSIELRPVPQS